MVNISQFIKQQNTTNKKIEFQFRAQSLKSKYFSLVTETSLLEYLPSKVAASCILATRRTLHLQPSWSRTLVAHTGYEENSLEDCCTLIING